MLGLRMFAMSLSLVWQVSTVCTSCSIYQEHSPIPGCVERPKSGVEGGVVRWWQRNPKGGLGRCCEGIERVRMLALWLCGMLRAVLPDHMLAGLQQTQRSGTG